VAEKDPKDKPAHPAPAPTPETPDPKGPPVRPQDGENPGDVPGPGKKP
jgi:hypothetical protein